MKRFVIFRSQPVNKRQNGYLLVLVMATSFALMALSVAIISVATSKYAKTSSDGRTDSAVYAAEAGISDTLARLNRNADFTGYTTKKTFYSNDTDGKAEYTTSVVDSGSNTITITSVGYMSPTPSSDPSVTRTIRALFAKTKTPLTENVYAGSAGLTMSIGSSWFGTPSGSFNKASIYSRGKVRLNGSNTRIGSSTDSINLTVANIGCGTASTWPQTCASGDQPISLNQGSGAGSIYGSVCATNQVSTMNIYPGPTGSGLQAGCLAPDYGIPSFDKAAFAANKPVVRTGASASCNAGAFQNTTVSVAANTRINGNVSMEANLFNSSCTMRILGDVYITGSLTMGSKTRIVVDDSVGTRVPKIVVNGKVILKSEMTGIAANSSDTGVNIVSFYSTSSCTNGDVNCTLSSTDSYNSSVQAESTNNVAISVEDGSFIYGTDADFSGAALYAYHGVVRYTSTGSKTMRGIGGQKVSISPGDSGSFFSSGGNLSMNQASPFTWLEKIKYSLIDYQQVF